MLFPLNVSCGKTSEEGVMLHTFLPKVFAVITVLKVELNGVLVVALEEIKYKISHVKKDLGTFWHLWSVVVCALR